MRVALLYPPPWKIALPEEPPYAVGGPPAEYVQGDLDADFYQVPYGLLALGAISKRAGHEVKVLNLSNFAWSKVVDVVRDLSADVYGLSCWTANRRGVCEVARAIKALSPNALVVVGGPHATPLAKELMVHCSAIDLVCVGEADETFVEILSKRGRGEPLRDIAGTAFRAENGTVQLAPERSQVKDLDLLPSPQSYFDTHILMTSRGCPWACTFCGAETSWGRGFRANSVEYVVDAIESVLARLPVKMIQVKDDTFTTNKKRVVELCREIRRRELRFFWSCDTRVDLLTDELLREMRLAGCERLSLGVESGSQRILDAIDKKITPAEIIESTNLAKRYGIKVRYYMMLGNRGETIESFDETLAFLEKARPHEYVFSCLSIYPGTRDFDDAERKWLDRSVYFREDFQELKTPFDADEKTTEYLNDWFVRNKGLRSLHRDDVAQARARLELLPGYHAAYMDLGAALYREGAFDEAESQVRKALALGYPLPGLAYNHLACIAYARGELDSMMDLFTEAARVDPQHHALIRNVERARAWFKSGGYARREPLSLEVRHDFQLLERTVQPTLPGPLPDDFADWTKEFVVREVPSAYVKVPEQEGSGKKLKLRTVS
ncbi:MAG: radical SAM protein [Polyangiaceae bacterium]